MKKCHIYDFCFSMTQVTCGKACGGGHLYTIDMAPALIRPKMWVSDFFLRKSR